MVQKRLFIKNYFKLFFRFINCYRIIEKMEQKKVLNSFNEASDFKFVNGNWNIANDQ